MMTFLLKKLQNRDLMACNDAFIDAAMRSSLLRS